jgi:hypothetical protein
MIAPLSKDFGNTMFESDQAAPNAFIRRCKPVADTRHLTNKNPQIIEATAGLGNNARAVLFQQRKFG